MLTRDELAKNILAILTEDFEFKEAKLDDNLRDVHGFDSIDAIELLAKIEKMLGLSLSRAEKEAAMEIRTINDILDYLEKIQSGRAA
jgi:acyl carrier protein